MLLTANSTARLPKIKVRITNKNGMKKAQRIARCALNDGNAFTWALAADLYRQCFEVSKLTF